jgi:hypothetical protein
MNNYKDILPISMNKPEKRNIIINNVIAIVLIALALISMLLLVSCQEATLSPNNGIANPILSDYPLDSGNTWVYSLTKVSVSIGDSSVNLPYDTATVRVGDLHYYSDSSKMIELITTYKRNMHGFDEYLIIYRDSIFSLNNIDYSFFKRKNFVFPISVGNNWITIIDTMINRQVTYIKFDSSYVESIVDLDLPVRQLKNVFKINQYTFSYSTITGQNTYYFYPKIGIVSMETYSYINNYKTVWKLLSYTLQ